MSLFFFLIIRRPPRSTRTDTLFPTRRSSDLDRRAPIFIGGGKAHGPRARTFGHSLNKKIRALGLKMALSDKAKGGKLVVLDTLELKDAKTKALAGKLGKLELGTRALFIDGDAVHDSFAKASANIVGIDSLQIGRAHV